MPSDPSGTRQSAVDAAKEQYVCHVRISGFEIRDNDYSPDDGWGGYRMGCEGAVHLSAASDCRIENNRFVNTGKYAVEADYNLYNVYWHAAGRPLTCQLADGGSSLDDWRKLGQDKHALVADPCFVDPEHNDYTLRPDSPAFKLGFQPIDTSRVGAPLEPGGDSGYCDVAESGRPWIGRRLTSASAE